MFKIAEVITLLTKIFVKQNKRFPKGLEGVDIRLKAKKIHDVGKANNYQGGISEDQLKQFLAWEKQAPITKEVSKDIIKVPGKKGEVFDLTGKKIQPDETIVGGKGYKIETEAEKKLELDKLLGPDDDVFGSPIKDWHMKKFKEPGAKDVTPKEIDIVTETITLIKSKKPIDAMKEANLVIGRKGKYKNLTIDESQNILKKTDDHIFERDIKYDEFGEIIKPDPEDLAHGGRTGSGLNYLLGEDDQNVRVPYQTGLKVYPKASVRIGEQGLGNDFGLGSKDTTYGGAIIGEKDGLYGGIDYLKIKNKIDFMKENQTLFKDTTDDEKMNFIFGKKGKFGDIRFKTDKDLENKQISWNLKFNEGGRVPYGLGGGFNAARRAFLKLMGAGAATGVAAKSGLFSLLKAGKPGVVKSLTSVPIGNATGMPVWYKPLVNRIIKEGNEIESGMEGVIVHKSKLPGSKTDLYVTQELDTGNVMVDVGIGKHGFAAGHLGQPIRLEYKAAEVIEPTISKSGKVTSKGTKTKPEFNIEEAEFSGGHPENVKFEESTFNKYGEQGSDLSEVEQFATGKSGVSTGKSSGVLNEKGSKQLRKDLSETKKRQQTEFESGKAEADMERWADEDFASGGRVPLGGGKLAQTLIQQIIKKYKGRIDDKLLNRILVDDNPDRLAEVMATLDEGFIMQQKGMGPETIIQTIKDSWKRKKQASGGLAGLLGE